MKVTLINKSDSTGGAAVVSMRLLEALRAEGIDARMIVAEKLTDSPYVALAASPTRIKKPFLLERLGIFLANGLNRKDLFKVDTAADGLPLWRHQWVREADVICLNWVNQGLLSLHGLRKIARLGKPVVWTMHDMWNFTGICHHAGKCERWIHECGNCPFLGSCASENDLSYMIWKRKKDTYNNLPSPVRFVAVSNWLAALARRSSLLKDASLEVIPNAFPIPEKPLSHVANDKFRIVMGAARIDDPVKGLPILVEATRVLRNEYPRLAEKLELVTFGNVRDPRSLDGIGIPHRHLGTLHGADAVRTVYAGADAVISTSLYETLPGTLVEGLAYGCIPVSFNRGGQSDIIDHLITGYIAEWNDDIRLAARNIAAGIAWAAEQNTDRIRPLMLSAATQRFSARAVAREYIRIFRSIC